jgi:hypothetical protein
MTRTVLQLAGCMLLVATVPAWPQSYREAWMADRQLAQDLRDTGVRCEMDSAVVFFEQDALTEEQRQAFAALVNKGIEDIRTYLKLPARTNKIQYFVSGRVDISHSRSRVIYLPLERVQNRSAPYLHETLHILEPCRHCETWLSEGFASFVQSYVSEHIGGYDGAIFARDGNKGVDKAAARWLTRDGGKAVVQYVGAVGEPPSMGEDRRGVAAPFYVMSQSFVKFLVERNGIEAMAAALRADDFEQTLESATKSTLDEMKKAWMAQIVGRE